MKLSVLVACVGLSVWTVSAAPAWAFETAPPEMAKPAVKALWDRLGGEPAVTAVVDDFVARTAANPKVNFFRNGIAGYPEWKPSAEDVSKLKRHLVTFISVASGGPLKYEGRSMAESHKGMKITEAEFAAIASDLKATLEKFRVPEKEQTELLAAVAGTAKDIVEVKSLWTRLGGEPAVTAVVEDFVGRAAANPKVNFFRKGVADYPEWKPESGDVVKLKRHLVTFISMAGGGPLKYEGRSMKDSHKGMKITQAEFDALAADLKASLDKFKVPETEQKELLGAVAGTAKDIVEAKW